MTHKWLKIGLKKPRIPQFYTLTKIHKKTPVGRPIVSGSSGPTERISSFVDSLLQPIAVKQESYLKDTTDFINFIENKRIPDDVILATLDVSSLYTNIPQSEGTEVICRYYEEHYEHNLPIPTNDLRELMRLILEENSFKFNERHFVLKLTALLWELRWRSLFLSFLWQTLKRDYFRLALFNLSLGKDSLMTYFLCGSFP